MVVIHYGTTLSTASAQAVRGNPSAPITIVEYVDFQCSDCAQVKKLQLGDKFEEERQCWE